MEAFIILFFIGGAFVYFIPSIIAKKSNHKNADAIMVVNIFLGWSLIGWVVALAWALKVD